MPEFFAFIMLAALLPLAVKLVVVGLILAGLIFRTRETIALLLLGGIITGFNLCGPMAGATIIGFAHTNKQPTKSGKVQYGGTTDLIDDFDAAYVASVLSPDQIPTEARLLAGQRLVQFECIKARGGNARLATFAYADEEDINYPERLASVRLISEEELGGFNSPDADKGESVLIAAVEACIQEQAYSKMKLAKVVAQRTRSSERAAIRVIERYTGSDPATAKWCFQRKDRGAMVYALLTQPEPAVSHAA